MKAALYKNVFKFLVKQSAETIAQSKNGRVFHAQEAVWPNIKTLRRVKTIVNNSTADRDNHNIFLLRHRATITFDLAFR